MPVERRWVTRRLDLADERLCRIVGDIDERHLRTLRGELRHVLGANAAGPAGDEHHAVAQARVDGKFSAHALRSFSLRTTVIDDRIGRLRDRHHDRMLVLARLLQRRELAVQQRRRHEVVLSYCHPLGDQRLRALQIHQHHVGSAADQNVAIGTPECRARHDALLPLASYASISCAIACSQGQRSSSVSGSAGVHLRNIGRRMETRHLPVRRQPCRSATPRATVVLPLPDTPIMTAIIACQPCHQRPPRTMP